VLNLPFPYNCRYNAEFKKRQTYIRGTNIYRIKFELFKVKKKLKQININNNKK